MSSSTEFYEFIKMVQELYEYSCVAFYLGANKILDCYYLSYFFTCVWSPAEAGTL